MKADLKIAFRDSKTATRPYVIINPLLAKHLPIKPSQSMEYFKLLGMKVAEECKGERILVIGFAETATAVGATVAAVAENAIYVHTTRENMPQDKVVAVFTEEHSHAKNQALYLDEKYKDLSQFDRIVFVEDEITTGKTILNFLANINWNGKIIVSALVFNGFNEAVFSKYDAVFLSLQKTGEVSILKFNNYPNPRTGVNILEYNSYCHEVASKIIDSLDHKDITNKNILVVGTEEFMYPALYLGCELEKTAKTVKSHSTTRSPLLPQSGNDYPIKTRSTFASVYDDCRTTFLYNLKKYDTVIVVTDSDESACSNCSELLRTIQSYGNHKIYLVRVQEDD